MPRAHEVEAFIREHGPFRDPVNKRALNVARSAAIEAGMEIEPGAWSHHIRSLAKSGVLVVERPGKRSATLVATPEQVNEPEPAQKPGVVMFPDGPVLAMPPEDEPGPEPALAAVPDVTLTITVPATQASQILEIVSGVCAERSIQNQLDDLSDALEDVAVQVASVGPSLIGPGGAAPALRIAPPDVPGENSMFKARRSGRGVVASKTPSLPTGLSKEIRPLYAAALAAGWTVKSANGKHLKLRTPDGEIVVGPKTPSDSRAIKNFRAHLRRLGVSV